MTILLWTFAPVMALVLATVWAHWRNRPRGPVDAQDSIGEYERFCAAIGGQRIAPETVDLHLAPEVLRSR
jgi:hypothetical protein